MGAGKLIQQRKRLELADARPTNRSASGRGLGVPGSGLVEALPDLSRHRFRVAVRSRERGLLREVGRSERFPATLLRDEPEVEVRSSLHHGQVIGTLDIRGRLDRRNEPVQY